MGLRKDIFNRVVEIIENIPDIKKVYRGVVPTWGNVRNFPACAVWIESVDIEPENMMCRFSNNINLSIFIYHKHKGNTYDDILSDIIDSIENAIKNDETLQSMVTHCYPSNIAQDGGVLYPYTMAELQYKIGYIQN